jgi:hypothetical protein
MSPFEFLSYESTPGEKYYGIATVRAWGKIILKYKIVPGKDGQGFFPAPGSYKVGIDPLTGKDRYDRIFMVDSSYENKLLEDMIRHHVTPYLSGAPQTGQNSTIGGQPMQYHQSTQKIESMPNTSGSYAWPGDRQQAPQNNPFQQSQSPYANQTPTTFTDGELPF